MKYLLLCFALFVWSVPASAASWTIDPAQSELSFTGTQTGKEFSGHFKNWTAQIEFDPANPAAGHALVTIDMASATTGDKQRDEALPENDWFAVKQFPQAVFEANNFQFFGDNKFIAESTLTIRGQKKTMIFPFTLDTKDGKATVDSSIPILRTNFGVGQGDWASGEYVGLEVTVKVHLVATAN